ncbi:MAG: thioredoxin domain-containing protein [Terriglobia bacterium]
MSLRKLAIPFLMSAVCLAAVAWQAVTDIPGVDWHGLTGVKKTAAIKFLRTEACTCGCNKKLAECRVTDSTCTESRKLAGIVTKEMADGKTPEVIKADIIRIAGEPPPLLDEPVKISIEGDPIRGPEKARMTIIEFSDFQCPFCSKAVAEAKEVMRKMPNDVRLVFKQFPLDTHSEAEFGAEASLAAQAQGKFWEMHDLLYAGFPDLSNQKIMAYAKELNLDMARFKADLASHKYRARTRAEEQQGEVAGVSGTPSFFFNGKHYNGAFEASTVVALLKKELK